MGEIMDSAAPGSTSCPFPLKAVDKGWLVLVMWDTATAMLTDGPDIGPRRTVSLVCQGLEASWLTSLMQGG